MLPLDKQAAIEKIITLSEGDTMEVKNGWVVNPFVGRAVFQTPAYIGNYYPARVCTPIALVLHEPQEEADDRESTPVWFQNPDAKASTRWYGDSDGDIFQLVPFPASAIANGLDGRPEPRFGDGGPEFGGRSLNTTTDNIEVEGYTHNIAQTFTQAQYAGLCDWLVMGYLHWNLPRNTGRVLSHFQISSQRTDGEWLRTKSGVVQEAVNRVLQIEKDIKELKTLVWTSAVANNKRNDDQDKLLWAQQVQINELKK